MAAGQDNAKIVNAPALIPYTLRSRANRYCAVIRRLSGFDPSEESRRRPVVTARAFVAYRLALEGFTEHAVGAVLGWDHATIHYYCRRADTMLHTPGYEAEQTLWTQFNDKI